MNRDDDSLHTAGSGGGGQRHAVFSSEEGVNGHVLILKNSNDNEIRCRFQKTSPRNRRTIVRVMQESAIYFPGSMRDF